MKNKKRAKRSDLKTFLAVTPVEVEKKLREEATSEGRSRTAQLAQILKERYGFVPPENESVAA